MSFSIGPFRPTHCEIWVSGSLHKSGCGFSILIPLPETLNALLDNEYAKPLSSIVGSISLIGFNFEKPLAEYHPLSNTYQLMEPASEGGGLGILSTEELTRPKNPGDLFIPACAKVFIFLKKESDELQRLREMQLRFHWMAATALFARGL